MRVPRIPFRIRGRLILASVFFALPASATTLQHVDTRELVRSSAEIVVGQVDDARSY